VIELVTVGVTVLVGVGVGVLVDVTVGVGVTVDVGVGVGVPKQVMQSPKFVPIGPKIPSVPVPGSAVSTTS
jgi:hypothetical protein